MGTYAQRGFRWTHENGLVYLLQPVGATHWSAEACSADGYVVVGDSGGNGEELPTIWTGDHSEYLPQGSTKEELLAVSGDGTIWVGNNWDNHSYFRGVSGLTANGRPTELLALPGDNGTHAEHLSRDGRFVTGSSINFNTNIWRAVRWDLQGGLLTIPLAELAGFGGAYGISGNGSKAAVTTVNAMGTREDSFLYTFDPPSFQYLTPGYLSQANAISSDGNHIVGAWDVRNVLKWFIWTPGFGPEDLLRSMTVNGVAVSTGFKIDTVNAVETDGDWISIVGQSRLNGTFQGATLNTYRQTRPLPTAGH